MAQSKFEDCVSCKFKRSKKYCEDCDFGEFYEEIGVRELDFESAASFARSRISLITEDDEPDHNPDDLFRKIEEFDDEEGDYIDD